jgi:probable phosphoglycerate mutase
MRLYLIRHADPDYPNNTITPYGHKEAEALAARLAKEDLTRLYSSPMGRARDTMRYTADLLPHHVPAIEDWTAEFGGTTTETEEWGRIAIWDLPGEVIRGQAKHPRDNDWQNLPYVAGTPMSELFDATRAASDAFLARHGYEREGGRYRCVAPNRERIAVFCHGGFGLAWLSHLLEIPLPLMWSGFWLPPSSVTTILMEQRTDTWAVPRCVGLGDVSHLYAAGLPVRPRGIHATNW